MKCPKCLKEMGFWVNDGEIVCEHCGSAFALEYLGYYPEGEDERIDEGYEDQEQLTLIKQLRKESKK